MKLANFSKQIEQKNTQIASLKQTADARKSPNTILKEDNDNKQQEISTPNDKITAQISDKSISLFKPGSGKQKNRESNVRCSCCSRLVYMTSYKPKYQCNHCFRSLTGKFFHCRARSIRHPLGLDICYSCAELQLVKQIDKDGSHFQYGPQLKQLLEMGFEKDKAKRLLLTYDGDLGATLAALVQ